MAGGWACGGDIKKLHLLRCRDALLCRPRLDRTWPRQRRPLRLGEGDGWNRIFFGKGEGEAMERPMEKSSESCESYPEQTQRCQALQSCFASQEATKNYERLEGPSVVETNFG